MRISGHRSEISLKSYSSRLSVQDKRIISDTLWDDSLTQRYQMTTSTLNNLLCGAVLQNSKKNSSPDFHIEKMEVV